MVKNICKIKKRLNDVQGLSSTSRIYLTYNNKIIKTVLIKRDNESEWLDKVNTVTKRGNVDKLFNPYLEKRICKKFTYFLFNRLKDDLDILLLENIKKEDKRNILMQCLLATYVLNNKLKIFHNDLYMRDKLRNFMYKKNKRNFNVEIDGMKVTVGKYNVKIIDFNTSKDHPAHFTTAYHPPELKIISECFLVGYYFFRNTFKIENTEELKSFLVEGGLKIIEKLEREKDELTLENYDREIIKFYMKNFDDIYSHYSSK
tara:strand:+ start:89 stop:865 length:777 start_codon:yes stop_codon:yes gene_type:complete